MVEKGRYQWVLAGFGYLAYTLIVTVVLLWVLFPADSFRRWLQSGLNTMYPHLNLQVEKVETALPLRLEVSGINIGDSDIQEPVLRINTVQLTPPFADLFSSGDRVPFLYRVKALNGTMKGRGSFDRRDATLSLSGSLDNMELGGLDTLWKQLNRPVSGRLSAEFEYRGRPDDIVHGELQADLAIHEGSVGLLQPVLGMESLDFNQASSVVTLKDAIIHIGKGELESRLFAGTFSGTITLADTLAASGIDVQGDFEPRPEFLGSMQNQTTVTLIRTQLQEGRLSYAVGGTVMTPGILFEGASGVIDGIIEGGLR